MNKALELINWRQGGNHYILRATSDNKWVGFQESVINKLRAKFNDSFYLVIWSDEKVDNDYYKIPFGKLSHLFTEEHKTTGNHPDRWTATILGGQFLMHSNSSLAVDICQDYGGFYSGEMNPVVCIEEDLIDFEIENEFFEGYQKKRLTNYYERNPSLRKAAIQYHGFKCQICNFEFKEFYGEHGEGFIEVHHVTPVCELNGRTMVCPKKDMMVVCSNCHRMLHRSRVNTLSPDQLRGMIGS